MSDTDTMVQDYIKMEDFPGLITKKPVQGSERSDTDDIDTDATYPDTDDIITKKPSNAEPTGDHWAMEPSGVKFLHCMLRDGDVICSKTKDTEELYDMLTRNKDRTTSREIRLANLRELEKYAAKFSDSLLEDERQQAIPEQKCSDTDTNAYCDEVKELLVSNIDEKNGNRCTRITSGDLREAGNPFDLFSCRNLCKWKGFEDK